MDGALTIEDIDRPTVQDPTDVVVEVTGAGWCQTDNHVIEGMWNEYNPDITLPLVPGHENAGIVHEVGDAVTSVEPGDGVVCHPVMTCGTCLQCLRGEQMYCPDLEFCGQTVDGGFAEYLRTTERATVPLDGLDPVEIAPHADAGITAYHAIRRAAGDVRPGAPVLVLGVGGLGHIGLQIVDAMTAGTIIAADLKQEALALADRLGADHTVNTSEDSLAEAVADLTDDTGVSHVFDFVGADSTLAAGPDVLATGGEHHVVGYGGDLDVDSRGLIAEEIDFCGTLVGQYWELHELVDLVASHGIDLHVSEFPLEDINEVAARLEHGEIEGRAVITP
jgi:propanol-preferring alcohol dehydrogenase/NAD+-dependent secondary alcohol dehydrogenase Adh1